MFNDKHTCMHNNRINCSILAYLLSDAKAKANYSARRARVSNRRDQYIRCIRLLNVAMDILQTIYHTGSRVDNSEESEFNISLHRLSRESSRVN